MPAPSAETNPLSSVMPLCLVFTDRVKTSLTLDPILGSFTHVGISFTATVPLTPVMLLAESD